VDRSTRPGGAARARFEAAYRAASYRVTHPHPFSFAIGVESPALARLHQHLGVDDSAFVTAHNPHSQLLSPRENELRHEALRRELAAAGHLFFEGVASDPASVWPDEASLWVPDLGHEGARSLGQRWGQNAVVVIRRDAIPTIEWLS